MTIAPGVWYSEGAKNNARGVCNNDVRINSEIKL